jgi:hypothetical protein
MPTFHFCIKSGKRGKAATHAAYIARQGKHGKDGKQEDLVYVQHGNMPEWTNGDPSTFWKAADTHERANGAAYREFEVALPTELTREQNIELVQEFVQQVIGDKTFQVAIHEPTAAIGGVAQPHMHAMLSDRMQDGIQRSPEQHFKRFNPKHPEQGGCKKDSGGKEPAELKQKVGSLREGWANLQNAHLDKYGHAARVDHRSNHDRGIEKETEKHLGAAAIKQMSPEAKALMKGKRQNKSQSN